MSSKTSIALAALLAASAFSAAGTAGAEPQQGMVVVRDPQTGQFRNATPAEVKVLRAQQAQLGLVPPPPSVVTVRKDGSRHKHLGEASMVYSVVSRDADGKLGMHCVTGAEAADAALARPAPLTQPEHDHDKR